MEEETDTMHAADGISPPTAPQSTQTRRILTLLDERRARRQAVDQKFGLSQMPRGGGVGQSFLYAQRHSIASPQGDAFLKLLDGVQQTVDSSDSDADKTEEGPGATARSHASLMRTGTASMSDHGSASDLNRVPSNTTGSPMRDDFADAFSFKKKMKRRKKTVVDVALAHRVLCSGEQVGVQRAPTSDRDDGIAIHIPPIDGVSSKEPVHSVTVEESFFSLAEHTFMVNQALTAIRKRVQARVRRHRERLQRQQEADELANLGNAVAPLPGVRTIFYFPSALDSVRSDPKSLRERRMQAIVRRVLDLFEFSPACLQLMLGRCEGSLLHGAYRVFPTAFDAEVVIEPAKLRSNLEDLSHGFMTRHQVRRLTYYLCGREMPAAGGEGGEPRMTRGQSASTHGGSPLGGTDSLAATARSTTFGGTLGSLSSTTEAASSSLSQTPAQLTLNGQQHQPGVREATSTPVPEDPFLVGIIHDPPDLPKTTLQLLGLCATRRSSASRLGEANAACDPSDSKWRERPVLATEIARRLTRLLRANAKHCLIETYYTLLPPVFREQRMRHMESAAISVSPNAALSSRSRIAFSGVDAAKGGAQQQPHPAHPDTLIPPAINDARLRLLFDSLYIQHDVMQQRIDTAEMFRAVYHDILQHMIAPQLYPLPDEKSVFGSLAAIQTSMSSGALRQSSSGAAFKAQSTGSAATAAPASTTAGGHRYGYVPPALLQCHEDEINPPFAPLQPMLPGAPPVPPPRGKLLANAPIVLDSVPEPVKPSGGARSGTKKSKSNSKASKGAAATNEMPAKPPRSNHTAEMLDVDGALLESGGDDDDGDNANGTAGAASDDELLAAAMKRDRFDDRALYFEAFAALLAKSPHFSRDMLGVFLSHCAVFPDDAEPDEGAPLPRSAVAAPTSERAAPE